MILSPGPVAPKIGRQVLLHARGPIYGIHVAVISGQSLEPGVSMVRIRQRVMDAGNTQLVAGDWNMNGLFSHSVGDNHPNWLSYFSEGFKPPTRQQIGPFHPIST